MDTDHFNSAQRMLMEGETSTSLTVLGAQQVANIAMISVAIPASGLWTVSGPRVAGFAKAVTGANVG